MDKWELSDKVATAAKGELAAMIDAHWPECWDSLKAAFANHDGEGDKPFRYKVGLSVTVTPRGAEFAVEASIAWSVKHHDTSDGRLVSAQKELPL